VPPRQHVHVANTPADGKDATRRRIGLSRDGAELSSDGNARIL
jgi:hypothetical protein